MDAATLDEIGHRKVAPVPVDEALHAAAEGTVA
jgi:hypothetical protein